MHDLQITLWLLVFVGFIALLIAGATNRVVIYFDLKDFAISFAPWGTLLITTILIKIFSKEGATGYSLTQYLVLFAGGVIATGFFIQAIKLSIFYNKSTAIGIIVGLFNLKTAVG